MNNNNNKNNNNKQPLSLLCGAPKAKDLSDCAHITLSHFRFSCYLARRLAYSQNELIMCFNQAAQLFWTNVNKRPMHKLTLRMDCVWRDLAQLHLYAKKLF